MMLLQKASLMSFLLTFVLQTSPICATTTTMSATANGPAGANDDWNEPANWSGGIPTGAMNAIINAGLDAQEFDVSTPTFDGNITLKAGATIDMRKSRSPLGNGNMFLEEGSIVYAGFNPNLSPSELDFGEVTLLGNATFSNKGNWADHETRKFTASITGNYHLTINGRNNMKWDFEAANFFNGLEATGSGSPNYVARTYASDSLGLGNVVIGDYISLEINAANCILDSADLHLNGSDSQKPSAGTYNKLDMNADDTVNKLFIDGLQQLSGNYTNAESWIDGSGTLTVLTDPPPIPPNLTSIVDDIEGEPIWEDYGANIIYTVTFDLDMDDSTVTPADFENGGNATISVDSVTETAAGVFSVTVRPISAGNLVLQIKSGELLQTSVSANLDTTSPLPDDTELIINSGNSPDTTITGTANGPGGSDDTWNLRLWPSSRTSERRHWSQY